MDLEQQAQIDERDSIYGRLANFEIDKKIGKGQFSEVYRARCKIDGSVVALKKVQVFIWVLVPETYFLTGHLMWHDHIMSVSLLPLYVNIITAFRLGYIIFGQ